MITGFSSVEDFFQDKGKNQVFVFYFPLLYQYEDILLKKLYKYWPELKVAVRQSKRKKNRIKLGTYRNFSSKCGRLCFISLKLAEPSDYSTQDKNVCILRKVIKAIKVGKYDILKVNISSFRVSVSDTYRNKIYNLFAENEKNFKLLE